MAKNKYDGVIVAAHFDQDRRVKWVRAYIKRGAVFSDRLHLDREELIAQIKSGKKFMTGSRVEFKAATFKTNHQVKLQRNNGAEILLTGENGAGTDSLEGVPEI
ncbi:MAG: hypothetical protein ACK2TW_06550 [Anaerolineales bacterium]|jgi:hypothetical protein